MERLVFMNTEDSMVVFEREDGSTIVYAKDLLPNGFFNKYEAGDIIKANVHNENCIEFLGLDIKEMDLRRASLKNKKSRLRSRSKRTRN